MRFFLTQTQSQAHTVDFLISLLCAYDGTSPQTESIWDAIAQVLQFNHSVREARVIPSFDVEDKGEADAIDPARQSYFGCQNIGTMPGRAAFNIETTKPKDPAVAVCPPDDVP